VDEQMDLVRLGHFSAYQAKNPPVHVAFARFIGWKADDSFKRTAGEPLAAGQSAGAILDELIGEGQEEKGT
jgi:hypothetical protein